MSRSGTVVILGVGEMSEQTPLVPESLEDEVPRLH